jgi:high-affinity Fe2+/Pb2+ permease
MAAKRIRVPLAASALVALAPGAAQACAVCFSGEEESGRIAYLTTTLLMSALPLGMIGGLVWWLRRRAAELRGDYQARSASIATNSANK